MSINPHHLQVYKSIISLFPEVALKGASVPYTSLNGHMFSYFEKDGSFGLRLPKEELAAFLEQYNTTLFRSYGVVKKEFATVPPSMFDETELLCHYFQKSLAYAKTLKAK